MWWDTLIVAALVTGAAAYLVRRRLRAAKLPPSCAACGCSCSAAARSGNPPCSSTPKENPFR